MKQQKTLSSRLVSRYLLIIRDEESFAEKRTFAFTPAKLIVILVVTGLVIVTLSFFAITTLLAKWVDPQYQALQTKIQLSALENKIDSLNHLTTTHAMHQENIRKIINGEIDLNEWGADSVKTKKSTIDSATISGMGPIDSVFRKEFEDTDYDVLTLRNNTKETLQQLHFFPPVRGIITAPFDVKKRHFGTDVVAKKNEPIKCTADGTVIMADFMNDGGYVIAVQHKNQLISFYKHNSALLKKVGDVVKAGDLVAIIGNSGEQTDGPHLHFELWHKGNPVDPEDFVHF
ncbi:MAG: M23 family metallopeptidase [Flammeovirgaceae bacterium]